MDLEKVHTRLREHVVARARGRFVNDTISYKGWEACHIVKPSANDGAST
jgi:hypothetical protein